MRWSGIIKPGKIALKIYITDTFPAIGGVSVIFHYAQEKRTTERFAPGKCGG